MATGASRSPIPDRSGSDRGQSGLIGAVLLIGIVLGTAALIAASGAGLLSDFTDRSAEESGVNKIEEIDTTFSSVASVSGPNGAEFALGDASPGQFEVVRSGFVNVSVNRNASCTAHVSLESLRFETENGGRLVYEAGGVFRLPAVGNGSALHTPPDLTFDDGILSLSIPRLSGNVTSQSHFVRENATASRLATTDVRDALFQGDCARPDNVTITVRSDLYEAWHGYLDDEINETSISKYAGNRTVSVFLDQDKLPPETDDARNDVVDLTNGSFTAVEITNSSIKVNKSANNTYTTIVTPLSNTSTQVGEIRSVETDQVFRSPIDVVFVLDESGSMGNDPDGDGDTKMREAKDAARTFVGQMNASFDRAGAVSFDDNGYFLPNGTGQLVYLTDAFGNVNESIESISDSPSGGTHSVQGLRRGNAVLGLKSNSSRSKVMVLLSDGKDDAGADDPIPEAEIADEWGTTIHTIAFGDGADNESLRDIANTTGGTFNFVSESDDLSAVFVELFAEISEAKQIVRDPFSMQLADGATTFDPQIDGETSHVANDSGGRLNLNDPLAPTEFSYSIDVQDGDNLTMTAFDYECDEWEATDIVRTNTSTGKEYAEVRCTDINDSSVTTIPPSDMNVFVDGDNVSSLLTQPQDWWQEDLQNETLAPFLESDNETLDLRSNAAIVVFRFPDGDDGVDRLLAHYRIGQSDEESTPRYIFNIQVSHLEIAS